MIEISRKDFCKKSLQTLMTYTLLEYFWTYELLAKPAQPLLNHWVSRLNSICLDLKSNRLKPAFWQKQCEALFEHISLSELLTFIDFEKLSKNFHFPEDRANTRRVYFPKMSGLPEKTVFTKKIFGLKRGRAIIPHGHQNMASMHMVLKGEFALKHFERIEDDDRHMIILPTLDKVSRAGDRSSISDDKDNIHWLKALSQTAFTFDVIVTGIDPGKGFDYQMDFLDPDAATPLSKGYLKAPKLSFEQAIKKYGR